jgi:hypothetical protein
MPPDPAKKRHNRKEREATQEEGSDVDCLAIVKIVAQVFRLKIAVTIKMVSRQLEPKRLTEHTMNLDTLDRCISCNDPLTLEPSRSPVKLAWCETTVCRISGKARRKHATVFWCKPCADATFPQNMGDFMKGLPCAA